MTNIDNAKKEVVICADRWAREILREDRLLNSAEQALLDAVLFFNRINKVVVDIPPQFPRPGFLPEDLLETIEPRTARYSDIPTAPSPPFGTPIDLVNDPDIEPIIFEDLEEWIGNIKR
ncbi:MAG: hypothetical protein WC942_03425 [Clostridia bacterium]|jgi:hypothetical protein